ncbi:MAG: hypothetical protein DCF20_18525 [Pseudanabaena sp.]|nr:MAG: hypothetical protein DCF20_18525 [Pseudanabaena sp.]
MHHNHQDIPISYTHFTASERSQLYKSRVTDKLSQSVIAAMMKRSKSTILRELSCNCS